MAQSKLYLHHNRGVVSLRYTCRMNREILKVYLKPVNRILEDADTGEQYLMTKGFFKKAEQLGRIRIDQYTGNWPRLVLAWTRIKEIYRERFPQ